MTHRLCVQTRLSLPHADPKGKGSADFLLIYVTYRCGKRSKEYLHMLHSNPVGDSDIFL